MTIANLQDFSHIASAQDLREYTLYKDTVIVESKLKKNNKFIKKEFEIENLLNQREYAAATTKNNISIITYQSTI